MVKIRKPTHRTSILISNAVYVLLNVILAIAVVGVVDIFDSPWLGLAIVVISKWRIFAVKARFWWANLTSNLTDLLVGFSYVLLIYYISGAQFYYQIGLACLYLIWLLLVKPGIVYQKVMTQGLASIFISNLTLSIFGHGLPLPLFLMAELFIGYNIMRHYLTNCDFEAKYTKLMSGIWGLIMMELAWINWHWMVGYNFIADVKISQLAIISTGLTLVAYKTLHFMNEDSLSLRKGLKTDLLLSIGFVGAIIVVMLVLFSKPMTTL